MKILVTGAAGFIGSSVIHALLKRGDQVFGIDNLNDYYDVSLKQARLARLSDQSGFQFEKFNIVDRARLEEAFKTFRPDRVIHLAAQAGVRYSLTHPQVYIDSNITGTLNVLEACRHHPVEHLVYASSSSVYGGNAKLPFAESDNVDHPVSLYAATKKANELMAHTYGHLYGVPATGLRFFTVYGPWGRPDMALFIFTGNMLRGKPIEVFNHGNHRRDFTYVDDIVEGVVRVLDHPEKCGGVYNIGHSSPVGLNDVIGILEGVLGCKATRKPLPAQPGDVNETFAEMRLFEQTFGFRPRIRLQEGIEKFVAWYRDYYRI